MNSNKIIRQLEKIKADCPDQEFVIETPEGTASLRIGEALIYEGMHGEIVIDSE